MAPARGKGAEQRLRSCCRVPTTHQQPLSPLPCCGASLRSGFRRFRGGHMPGAAGLCPSPTLIVTIPVFLTRDVGYGPPSLPSPLTPGGTAPVTLVPSERRATTSERQATGFVTCFKTHPAWSLLFHYPKSQRNHPAGSISHRQPDSFLVLY